MARLLTLLPVWLVVSLSSQGAEPIEQQRTREVANTAGLIAFWDFSLTEDGVWTSYYDRGVVDRGYPVRLRRIGDPQSYAPDQWPYEDEESRLQFDSSGPFGRAVRFHKGHLFAEVARDQFDQTPLDVHGRRPFTLIAWARFVGRRHLVAGIWDEGGWDKYGGRRQIALFGGLFGSKGVIGHVSATGAASYPQSTVSGSQYARCRAIDGQAFENNRWVSMAMTFDPKRDEVVVYCDGVATATRVTDPVVQDVFRYDEPVASNPYHFPWPVYSPRSFVLKFNGYDAESSGVYEHWLEVDTERAAVTYDRSCRDPESVAAYRVRMNLLRNGERLLSPGLEFPATERGSAELPAGVQLRVGDEIVAALDRREDGAWQQVGTEIRYRIREGAPFTFGRALGLGTEPIDHGTEIEIDGVAVFNRLLDGRELRALSFSDH